MADKSWSPAYVQDLEEVEEAVVNRQSYMSMGGAHVLKQKARKHMAQRSNECRSDYSASRGRRLASAAYTSAPKRMLKMKFKGT